MSHTANACAKCILFGEHSILDGGTAIAFPVNQLRLEIEYLPGDTHDLFVDIPVDPQAKLWFWDLLRDDFSDCNTEGTYYMRSHIPIAAGLGSSAALCVALNRLFRKNISQYELIERAWKSEFKFHGKSSGIDPATIATEKPIYFKNPSEFSPLVLSPNLQSKHVFVLLDSQVRRSTQGSIAQSEGLKARDHKRWKELTAHLQKIVTKGKDALETGNVIALAELMNEAHASLGELGVSHEKLESLRSLAIDCGALAAKLTGAGRGGFLIALFDLEVWSALKAGDHSQFGSFLELRL